MLCMKTHKAKRISHNGVAKGKEMEPGRYGETGVMNAPVSHVLLACDQRPFSTIPDKKKMRIGED